MAKKKKAKTRASASSADLSWWTEARFGMFIHWGLYALAARHEWVKQRENLTDTSYRKYFDHFDPDLYDPVEWAMWARNAGMKYVVITSKHHEGFCLWDSEQTEYKATNTPYGKDLLEPFVSAFRAQGLKVGFYYSLIDWHHPDFTADRIYPKLRLQSKDDRKEYNNGRSMKRYAEYMRNQVTELLTRFHPDIIWYDFSYPGEEGKGRDDWESEKLLALTRSLCPGILVNNRLDLPGSPDFVTPEQYQPPAQPTDEKGKPLPWEACQTFSGSWGYHRDEMSWKSLEQLLGMLIDGVSKNGNLLLNVGPTARGLFDDRACEALSGIGEWMDLHERSITGCGAAPKRFKAPADCRYTYNRKTRRLYLHILAWPFRHIHTEGLRGRVEYAQLLHDASEVFVKEPSKGGGNMDVPGSKNAVVLELPVRKPDVAVPVVEIFLK